MSHTAEVVERAQRTGRDLLPLAALASTAGMRSMTAPAALARSFVRRKRHAPRPGVIGLVALALGELVADKLPRMGSRMEPLPLLARAASGAVVGYVAAEALDRKPAEGAVIGAGAAIAMSALAYQTRRSVGNATHVPDRALGAVEDVLALGLASWAASRLRERARGTR